MFKKLTLCGLAVSFLAGCITLPPPMVIVVESHTSPASTIPPVNTISNPPIEVSVSLTGAPVEMSVDASGATPSVPSDVVKDNVPDPPTPPCEALVTLLAMDTYDVSSFIEGNKYESLVESLLARVYKVDKLLKGIDNNGKCKKENR